MAISEQRAYAAVNSYVEIVVNVVNCKRFLLLFNDPSRYNGTYYICIDKNSKTNDSTGHLPNSVKILNSFLFSCYVGGA